MDTKAFLSAVVPAGDGYLTIHWQDPESKKFSGRSCRTVDDAHALVADLKDGPHVQIYFCLSRQKLNSGKRSQKNALTVQALWVDIDIPKHYATLTEAIQALLDFCTATGIRPPSILVMSGGGLHGYWLSDRTLSIEEWQPYADGLKTAARNWGLVIDFSVTGDAARVLRVPETLNYKYDPPRPVHVLQRLSPGTCYDFAARFAGLLTLSPAAPAPHGRIAAAFECLDPNQGFAGGIEGPPPLPIEPILANCPWLREAHETGGRDYDQPQWNMTTLAAVFLQNGHEHVHAFGKEHPDYTPELTEAMWERKNREQVEKNLGWPSCSAIQDAGAKHCKSCRHLAKGKSPLNFGRIDAATPKDEEIEALGGRRPDDLDLPEGFVVDGDGNVCAFIPTRIEGKKHHPARLLRLLKTKIRDVRLQLQEGQFGLTFTATTDVTGEHDVFLSSTNVFAPNLFTQLARKCVLYEPGKETEAYMGQFAPSWLDKLLKQHTAVRDSGTMGWRYAEGERIGFVHGPTLYHENGAVVSLVEPADDEFRSWYEPTGTRDAWVKAAKLLTDRKRPELDILISIAFAAPLLSFTGTLYGGILSVWGPPGTAKSTAQQVAAAVWGHPKQTRESLDSTPKSVRGRLGRIKNLPAFWDDVQSEQHLEALFQTMFVATQGVEGGRLNTDTSYKPRLGWQTLMVSCSNASVVEYLLRKQKSTTAGIRRVFELEFPRNAVEPGIVDSLDASKAFAALEHNFGVVGAEYAKILATEHKEIELLMESVTKSFTRSVKGTGDEGYWWGICGALLAGASLARRLGAEVDIPAMDAFLQEAYWKNRKIRMEEGTEGGSVLNVEHGLTGFCNLFVGSGNVMWTDRLFHHRMHPVKLLRAPERSHPIYIQIARDERKVVISKKALREYLEKADIRTRQIMDGLIKYYDAKEARLTLGAGTEYAQSQEMVFEIPVPAIGAHVLRDLLHARGEPDIRPRPDKQPPGGDNVTPIKR